MQYENFPVEIQRKIFLDFVNKRFSDEAELDALHFERSAARDATYALRLNNRTHTEIYAIMWNLYQTLSQELHEKSIAFDKNYEDRKMRQAFNFLRPHSSL